ncbi:MAG: type III ribulose-bisphosphate carboxylase, partial [Euryarchaeota archaeon]|nr:type III ribulose-bisphosphate carboxylase [Euryarchaeota archaeon]MBU4339634.1 type III ribulose-bisphosphate carboxylase [Euryarchaeota archaeon]MBU4453667.1 type III ribulose-bisphosphate carboxylase [Euryarchaeota archaeon]MCG2735071.1 type III ribulose-bisphosphate carboxylase [Candidatus Methanoperedenaceae archaeon]
KIAYPSALFEVESIPQLLSSIAGNIFSMKLLNNLRLMDVTFPKEVINSFHGPKFGIKGIRKLLGVQKRPLCGTIVKPKVGLISKDHAKVAYEAWVGGCDIVKDDENLTNQKFNPFNKRVIETLRLRDKTEKETGEKKMYMANITAPTCGEMIKRAKFVKEHGGEYIMIDIIPVGWTALQTLREENESLGLVLHAHRCMHSALTRNPIHGVSMQVIAKLTRMAGLDQLHIGTVVGKMHGGREEVKTLLATCESRSVKEDRNNHVLAQEWGGLKPVMAVASGGLQPAHVPELMQIMGNDVVMQFGGGIHAHPMGTRAGAAAVRQAIDAVMDGEELNAHAIRHKELKVALEKWRK